MQTGKLNNGDNVLYQISCNKVITIITYLSLSAQSNMLKIYFKSRVMLYWKNRKFS